MELLAINAKGCVFVCSCLLRTALTTTRKRSVSLWGVECSSCTIKNWTDRLFLLFWHVDSWDKTKGKSECHISDVVRMRQSRVQLSVRSICRQTLGCYRLTLSHNYAPNRVTLIPGVYLFKSWPAAGNVPVLKMHQWKYCGEIICNPTSVGGHFHVYMEGFKRSVSAPDANLWSLVRCNKTLSFIFCWSISHVCPVCRIWP